jgi:hypothetical protein
MEDALIVNQRSSQLQLSSNCNSRPEVGLCSNAVSIIEMFVKLIAAVYSPSAPRSPLHVCLLLGYDHSQFFYRSL